MTRDEQIELLAAFILDRQMTALERVVSGTPAALSVDPPDAIKARAAALLDQIAPLLTAEALEPTRVKVKPLVWQYESEDVQVATASAWHQYRIVFDRRATRGAWMWLNAGEWTGCESEEAAKAAAQADYEARILSALNIEVKVE